MLLERKKEENLVTTNSNNFEVCNSLNFLTLLNRI